MSDATYNGWTNRETWLVNDWFNPERKSDIVAIRDALSTTLEEKFGNTFWADFIDLDIINWQELEDSMEDDETEDDEEDEVDDDRHELYNHLFQDKGD